MSSNPNELIMPEDFYGVVTRSGGFTDTEPRRWTKQEVEWVLQRLDEGHTIRDVANAIGRTEVSVSIKVKRVSKKSDTYNAKHRDVKYAANQRFVELVKPESVLDLYAGNSYYKSVDIKHLVTNDIDEQFDTDYNKDALVVLCALYADGKKFDVVDLDPYGSAYDCFDLSLKMASKGIVISFGEWGHKRWKRYDYVRLRYGINSAEDFVQEKFVSEIQRLAAMNKKKLNVVEVLRYGHFLRVYCTVERLVITEQWEGKK